MSRVCVTEFVSRVFVTSFVTSFRHEFCHEFVSLIASRVASRIASRICDEKLCSFYTAKTHAGNTEISHDTSTTPFTTRFTTHLGPSNTLLSPYIHDTFTTSSRKAHDSQRRLDTWAGCASGRPGGWKQSSQGVRRRGAVSKGRRAVGIQEVWLFCA